MFLKKTNADGQKKSVMVRKRIKCRNISQRPKKLTEKDKEKKAEHKN